MGMTIEEAKLNLNAIQVYYNDNMQDGYVGFNKEDNESVEVAINTMRKYQKIQEIAEHWACCGNPSDAMIAISEVLEDGM